MLVAILYYDLLSDLCFSAFAFAIVAYENRIFDRNFRIFTITIEIEIEMIRVF